MLLLTYLRDRIAPNRKDKTTCLGSARISDLKCFLILAIGFFFRSSIAIYGNAAVIEARAAVGEAVEEAEAAEGEEEADLASSEAEAASGLAVLDGAAALDIFLVSGTSSVLGAFLGIFSDLAFDSVSASFSGSGLDLSFSAFIAAGVTAAADEDAGDGVLVHRGVRAHIRA